MQVGKIEGLLSEPECFTYVVKKKKVWDSRDFVLCQDRLDLLINEVTKIKFKKIIFLLKSLKN